MGKALGFKKEGRVVVVVVIPSCMMWATPTPAQPPIHTRVPKATIRNNNNKRITTQ